MLLFIGQDMPFLAAILCCESQRQGRIGKRGRVGQDNCLKINSAMSKFTRFQPKGLPQVPEKAEDVVSHGSLCSAPSSYRNMASGSYPLLNGFSLLGQIRSLLLVKVNRSLMQLSFHHGPTPICCLLCQQGHLI